MEGAEMMNLGRRLRQERERRHWTQEQLAERIDYTALSINRWEHGKNKIRQGAVEQLIKEFGKPPERWGIGYWHVPLLRNPYFTGREQILLRLHNTLAAENTMASSQTRAICGLGGIGKTQTALEYAYRYADEYEAVLWVQADSRETLISDFTKLAHTLDLPEKEETDQFWVIRAVKCWLEEHGPWLLIFDNADDVNVVSDFLPRLPVGARLLTTRSQITGMHIIKIEMTKMSQEEGISFLSRRSASSEEVNGEKDLSKPLAKMEPQAAQNLWEVMDGLPLALDQAGAYIEATQCSFRDYVNLYRAHRKDLLGERGVFTSEYPASVATTWSLSFQRVEQKDPAASELLQLSAFLSPDAIPEELITCGAAHLTPALQKVAGSALLLNHAISTLCAYSLVRRDPTIHIFSLHRLVQAVLQDALDETERRSWEGRALLVINVAFPKSESRTWSECARLLPHALLATQYIEKNHIISEEAGYLLHKTASYLQDHARYEEAEPLYRRALAIREQQLGPEHPDVAQTLNGLAVLYYRQGRHAEAEPLYQHASRIWEQQLGPEHPHVAYALSNLAALYREQGRYVEAESRLQRALQICERRLGPEHHGVAYPLSNLAALYREQNRYAEAEPLFLRALQICEKQVDPEHLDVAELLYEIAELHWQQREHEQAEPLIVRALGIYEQQLGVEHATTRNVREHYTALLSSMEREKEKGETEDE